MKNKKEAVEIITAVIRSDWAYMLRLFPEGVKIRTYKYNETIHFDVWDTYEDFARYVCPAQMKLKELCLNRALYNLTKKR